MNVLGNIASGFVCPRCESRDKQFVQWLDSGTLDALLVCAACEYKWVSHTR